MGRSVQLRFTEKGVTGVSPSTYEEFQGNVAPLSKGVPPEENRTRTEQYVLNWKAVGSERRSRCQHLVGVADPVRRLRRAARYRNTTPIVTIPVVAGSGVEEEGTVNTPEIA